MRSKALILFIFIITPSISFGQSSLPDAYGNYGKTLSHIEGVGVAVGVYAATMDNKNLKSSIKSKVQAKIRDAEGVRLYTDDNKEEFNATEESRPVLVMNVEIDVFPPPDPERGYEVELDVVQDVTIKGTNKDLRRYTYEVYGEVTSETYFTNRVNPLKMADRAINIMVDQFISDFREAKSN